MRPGRRDLKSGRTAHMFFFTPKPDAEICDKKNAALAPTPGLKTDFYHVVKYFTSTPSPQNPQLDAKHATNWT